MGDPRQVTRLLSRAGADPAAGSELLAIVYDSLRAMAAARMRSERPNHTLGATGLVHEAYVRLIADADITFNDRAHFYRTAAECMRRILVDHARARRAQKRGGGVAGGPLRIEDLAEEAEPQRVLDLDGALDALAAEDPRAAEIVKLRFFGGLSVEDTARTLELSERTVHREWAFAKARLAQLLEADGGDP